MLPDRWLKACGEHADCELRPTGGLHGRGHVSGRPQEPWRGRRRQLSGRAVSAAGGGCQPGECEGRHKDRRSRPQPGHRHADQPPARDPPGQLLLCPSQPLPHPISPPMLQTSLGWPGNRVALWPDLLAAGHLQLGSWVIGAEARACDVQETTTAVAPETTIVVAPCSKTANAFAAVAPPPAASKEDPFSTAAERSFDAPWCVEGLQLHLPVLAARPA